MEYVLPDYVLNELKCRRDPVSRDEAIREWLAVKAQIDAHFPNAGRRRRPALLEGFRRLRIARGVKTPTSREEVMGTGGESTIYMEIWWDLVASKGWLERKDLDEFVHVYNTANRHDRKPTWSAESDEKAGAGPDGRWRAYEYDELIARDKASLDIFWLRDESLADSDNLPPPEIIAQEIVDDLEAALEQFRLIADDLRSVVDVDPTPTASERPGPRNIPGS